MLGLLPIYGIQTLIFAFKLLIIDRSDDFMLLNFINEVRPCLYFPKGLLPPPVTQSRFLDLIKFISRTCRARRVEEDNARTTKGCHRIITRHRRSWKVTLAAPHPIVDRWADAASSKGFSL